MEDNKLIIYKNSKGNIIVDTIYKDETLWLLQKEMSKLFDVGVSAISKHLKNILEENELDKNSVVSKMEITATDDLLKFRRKEILNNGGSISHKEAVEKAEKEYEKFRVIQDQKYISSMDEFYNKYLSENKGEK